VLHRAHQTAEAADRPQEARAILHVAELFADDLARRDPQFDRVRFIQAATRDPASPTNDTRHAPPRPVTTHKRKA
jgi:hypothetical protein